MKPYTLEDFIRESNKIEGIYREPTSTEIEAYKKLLALNEITIDTLCDFVAAIQPGAILRTQKGMDVRVGGYIAPRGGENIPVYLNALLTNALLTKVNTLGPIGINPEAIMYNTHLEYEKLHPFTDGNGRSGRALWLWMRGGVRWAPLGFLHHWYYESLR